MLNNHITGDSNRQENLPQVPRVVGWYDRKIDRIYATCPKCGEHTHGPELGRRNHWCIDGKPAQYDVVLIVRPKPRNRKQNPPKRKPLKHYRRWSRTAIGRCVDVNE